MRQTTSHVPTLLVLGHSPRHAARTTDHLRENLDGAIEDCGSDVDRAVQLLSSRPVVAVIAATDGQPDFLTGKLAPLIDAASGAAATVFLTGASSPHNRLEAETEGVLWVMEEPASDDQLLRLLEVLIGSAEQPPRRPRPGRELK